MYRLWWKIRKVFRKPESQTAQFLLLMAFSVFMTAVAIISPFALFVLFILVMVGFGIWFLRECLINDQRYGNWPFNHKDKG